MAGLDHNMSLPLIVIPVFNAVEQLEACLQSISRTVPVDTEVLLIDDASTDVRVDPLARAWVSEAGSYRRLLRHEENKGFVATANYGMRLANRDLVLLHSDT